MKRVGFLWYLAALALLLVGALWAVWWHAQLPDEDSGATFCCREHSIHNAQ